MKDGGSLQMSTWRQLTKKTWWVEVFPKIAGRGAPPQNKKEKKKKRSCRTKNVVKRGISLKIRD